MNDHKNMPLVGVITFHRAINYGALLQAYALQEVLIKLRCRCNIIDYRNVRLESLHKENTLTDCHNWKEICRLIFYSKYHNKKVKKFREFSLSHLNLSDGYYGIDELRKITSEYDKFICGSDQIWNYKITNFDKAYFLDFVENKLQKYSYAASFGLDNIPSEYREEYKILLLNFNKITVRERQGAEIYKSLIGDDAEVVLDPTMLLSKLEWEKITTDYIKKDNYILLYLFGMSPTLKKFVKKLSKQTGCEIVSISYSLLNGLKATYERCVGPTEFLGLFKNARYIITNSFHGTAFSINFNKDFFIEMLPESKGGNSRLENILDLFGLRGRQIINGENTHVQEHIDYNQINQKLLVERQNSLNFLQKIIQAR
jgi:hypothetical protein